MAILVLPVLPAAATASSDESAAEWQMLCSLDHFKPDDPIVFPDQPGRSHMHSFYGNTTTAANSTTASLLAAPSSCGREMQQSDRSAYWIPSLYQKTASGGLQLVTDDQQLMFIYYQRAGGPDGPKVQPFPAGLRMVAGNPSATSAQPQSVLEWDCGGGGPISGNIPACSDPSQPIHASLSFPNCWDGKHLDSPDHRSHMAYPGPGGVCPATHPVSLPAVTFEVDYPGITGGPGYVLSSGGQYSMHGDFLAAWDSRVQNALVASCLNIPHNCLDITRTGNLLVKPAGDPGPMPAINLNDFQASPTVLGDQAAGAPSPSPSPSPSRSRSQSPAAASPVPTFALDPKALLPDRGAFPRRDPGPAWWSGIPAGAAGGVLGLSLLGYAVYRYRIRRRSLRRRLM